MQLEQIGKSLGPECIVCCDFHSGVSGKIWICEKIHVMNGVLIQKVMLMWAWKHRLFHF